MTKLERRSTARVSIHPLKSPSCRRIPSPDRIEKSPARRGKDKVFAFDRSEWLDDLTPLPDRNSAKTHVANKAAALRRHPRLLYLDFKSLVERLHKPCPSTFRISTAQKQPVGIIFSLDFVVVSERLEPVIKLRPIMRRDLHSDKDAAVVVAVIAIME